MNDSAHPARILIVDDEPYICEVLTEILLDENYKSDSATNGNEAIEKFHSGLYDLVLLDIGMPVMGGIDVLKQLLRIDPTITVIMATAQRDIETVVEAIKIGAEDYILKPFNDITIIKTAVQKALKLKAVKDENRYLKDQLKQHSKTHSIVGNSIQIQEVMKMVRKIAPLNTSVLITGETGTGKELVARAIHQFSERSDRKFISINCGGLPETLLESTLFGYEKGAFTGAYKQTKGVFEDAEGGTLFLDEIAETSPALQVRFLRVLQEKTFQRVGGTEAIRANVRIISATNKDLQKEVKAGNFREDLFYRLNVISISVPPLRERQDDIPLLIKHFIGKYAALHKSQIQNADKAVMDSLVNYNWPGNIRELENVIERAVALAEHSKLILTDLPDSILFGIDGDRARQKKPKFSDAKNNFERTFLLQALQRNNWNIAKAAREINVPRQNFYQKMKKYKLSRH
ncbi:sigma-54 dependent transcriptional regulator [bacterium]|nr:sigma-54 dependent transcriptional regulator [bacterium]MBU1063350.1 sigma-54 dependent transcriptional regulator [bacterium]MBU1633723.1 sigma-54 dependent transcriptional regulator [bacterium]MBU1875390.1 sigma-54 dependent transcriptional regulator [bacterium]